MRYALAALLLLIAAPAWAADQAAASCSRADVATAITAAASNGIVTIPAGTCDWTGTAQVNITGNVSLIGAGASDGGTTIVNDDGGTMFYWNPSTTNTDYFRLSGIRFYSDKDCVASCQATTLAEVRRTDNFRVDHNYIEGYWTGLVQYKSISKGLIDNNTLINHNIAVSGSYYGLTAGMPYDGALPSPYYSTPPNGLAICNTDMTYGCSCQVGDEATNRASSVAASNTVISSVAATIDGAATSGTGVVRRIYANIATAAEGATITVASFSRSGNVFTARARATALPVKAGSNIIAVDDSEFTAFAIHNGDYIGAYLDGCTLEATTGTTSWTVSGDQSAGTDVDFGTADIGGVSLYAEIFDDDDVFENCETGWVNWFNDTTRNGGYYTEFDRSWSYDANAIYIEDNAFTWYKSSVNLNWGGSSRMVVRHNTFNSELGLLQTFTKPGNNYGIWHDNTFTYSGGGAATGYTAWTNTDGLFYDNEIVNHSQGGSYEFYRNFSDYYFPFYVRPKEMYIWGNTYTNCNCGSTDSDCWYSANEGAQWMNQPGENGAIHFRAPSEGERLYAFTEYTYPHPLQGVVVYGTGTIGTGGSMSLGSGGGTITLQ